MRDRQLIARQQKYGYVKRETGSEKKESQGWGPPFDLPFLVS